MWCSCWKLVSFPPVFTIFVSCVRKQNFVKLTSVFLNFCRDWRFKLHVSGNSSSQLHSAGVSFFTHHLWPLTRHLASAYPVLMKLYSSLRLTVNNKQQIQWGGSFPAALLSSCEIFFLSVSQLEELRRTSCVVGLGLTCQQVCFDQGMRASWSLSLKDCWRM